MTRMGRPRWALAATGLLLVICTGLAAFVAHRRSAASEIHLGEPVSHGALGLRARLPVGWETSSPESIDSGQILLAAAPGEESGRELILFRVRLGTTPQAMQKAVLAAVQATTNKQALRIEYGGAGTIGSLESEVYQVLLRSREGARLGIANVTTGPDRQTFGVVILADDQLTARDKKLLDAVSQSVSLANTRSRPAASENPDETDEDDDIIPNKPMVSKDWRFSPA